MKEYLVHTWGGAWNKDANPSIKKDYGIESGYHYFQTEKEKDLFVSILKQPQYKKQGLMIDIKYGEMSHKRTIFVYRLAYKDKVYELEEDFGYEYEEEHARYMFECGNYSCDCNRALFIQRAYGEDEIEELECGEEIELLEYWFEYRD